MHPWTHTTPNESNCSQVSHTYQGSKHVAMSLKSALEEIDKSLLLELRIVHLQRRAYSFDLALPLQLGTPNFFSTQHYPAGLRPQLSQHKSTTQAKEERGMGIHQLH